MKEIRSQQIRRRNNMLSELAELIVEAFVRNGIPREKAVPESEEVAFQLHRRWAGLTFVFPSRMTWLASVWSCTSCSATMDRTPTSWSRSSEFQKG